MMDHAEALEQIEIAAVEPGGLDRLTAADTPASAAIAGHLAGCPACTAELARIRRTADLAREAIASAPDPALRDRTLAFVRAVGRDRSSPSTAPGGAIAAPGAPPMASPIHTAPEPAVPPMIAPRRIAGGWRVWLAAAAAVAIVVGSLGYLAGTGSRDSTIAHRDAEIATLADAAATGVRVHAQPDAVQVALAATPDGGDAAGSILFSPSEGELVALATDLPPLAEGMEYGCWVEAGGQRVRLGRMYPAGGLWSWAGPVSGLDGLPAGARFGVSAGRPGDAAGSTPVLVGTL
jgi:hypothetical protein